MASQFESGIVDPTDPTYTLANVGGSFGLDYVASYAEDALGNLYFLDFAYSAPYASNEGEIFRLTAVPEPSTAMLAILLSGSFATAFRRTLSGSRCR